MGMVESHTRIQKSRLQHQPLRKDLVVPAGRGYWEFQVQAKGFLGEDFAIQDTNSRQILMRVDSAAFSLRSKRKILDARGRFICEVQTPPLSFGQYTLLVGGRVVGGLVFDFVCCSSDETGAISLNRRTVYRISGSRYRRQWTITDLSGRAVASIFQRSMSLRRHYVVKLMEGVDAVLVLFALLGIERNQDRRDKS